MRGSLFKVSFASLAILSSSLLVRPADSAADEARASVWKVTSPKANLYLAGSVHLLRQRDQPFPPAYEVAYGESRVLVFEVDLGATLDEAGTRRVADACRLPPGVTLRDRVSEEICAMAEEYLKLRGLELRGLEGSVFGLLTPGMLATTIASFEHMRRGALPDFGVDAVYYRRAIEDGKPVEGLETTEFQLTLVSALSPEKQEALLRETLEGLGGAEETARRLVEAWRHGKSVTLSELLSDGLTADEELGELLLRGRHRTWLPRIIELLEGDHNAMVIVGTGHLVGKESLVSLLRERGYAVEQMRYHPARSGADTGTQ